MEARRVTKGDQVGPIGPTRAQRGANGGQEGLTGRPEGARRPPVGGRRSDKGPQGVPQSELDDSYTVSEGPEGGLKGKNLEKPRAFEHS